MSQPNEVLESVESVEKSLTKKWLRSISDF